MPTAFEIIGPENARLLDRVAEDVFDGPIHFERLRAYLAEPGHLMVVALSGDLVVGQVMAIIHRHPDKPTELYIDEVGVSPAFQRQGIATQLFQRVMELGRTHGCERFWVGTEADNAPAKALYLSLDLEAQEAVFFEGEL